MIFFNKNLYREMKCNSRYFHARISFLSDSIPFSFHSIFNSFSFHSIFISISCTFRLMKSGMNISRNERNKLELVCHTMQKYIGQDQKLNRIYCIRKFDQKQKIKWKNDTDATKLSPGGDFRDKLF